MGVVEGVGDGWRHRWSWMGDVYYHSVVRGIAIRCINQFVPSNATPSQSCDYVWAIGNLARE